MNIENILGTVFGDDTVMCITSNINEAETVCDKLLNLLYVIYYNKNTKYMKKTLIIVFALLCAGSANAQTLKEGEMPTLPPFPEIPAKQPIGSVKLGDINTFAEVKLGIPITDGRRTFGITINIKEAYETQCKSLEKAWQKAVMLLTIDENWKEHLREMDQLKQSVQNASYEQKDPLVIYKTEAFATFKNMVGEMNSKTVSILMRGQIPVQTEEEAQKQPTVQQREMPQEPKQQYNENRGEDDMEKNAREQRAAASGASRQPQQRQPIVTGPRVGRNDPCPCGSGKKYKQCHGRGL